MSIRDVQVVMESGCTLDYICKKCKFDATAAPTVNDDNTQGFYVGSRWINVSNDKEYVCLDATATAAVWTETTQVGGGSGALDDLSDVTIADPTDKELLIYDDGTSEWINATPAEAGVLALAGGTMSGNILFPAAKGMLADTSDGDDDGSIVVAGGGGGTYVRGAVVEAYGNEHLSQPGKLYLTGGSVANSDVILRPEGSETVRARAEGLLVTGAIEVTGEGAKLEKILIDTYQGTAADNRVINLGDDYNDIHIYLEEDGDYTATHLCEAYAIGTAYGVFWEHATIGATRMFTMASADGAFQGKMTGADANKIKLGSTGNAASGTNYSGWTYRIIAKKYAAVETLP